MKSHLLIALSVALLGGGVAQAQNAVCGPPGRLWFNAEYLLWWTNGQNFAPLVTTGVPDAALPAGSTAGLIGGPNTQVLFGGRIGDDLRSGARFSGGYWLDAEQTRGVMGRFYFLETAVDASRFDKNTNSVVMIPFRDETGAQHRFPVVYPNEVDGSTSTRLSSRFRAWDVNFMRNLYCDPERRLDGLIGFRSMYLNEDFTLQDIETDLTGNTTGLQGFSVTLNDNFGARNAFYGLDLGLSYERRFERLYFQLMARVGLGCTNRRVSISGSGSSFDPTTGATTPVNNGLFAQSSNGGSHTDNEFSIVPEVGVNVGYQVTSGIRVFANYSFLYWNNVARPGPQVDPVFDLTNVPPTVPVFAFKDTDFWAQGVSFGFDIRY